MPLFPQDEIDAAQRREADRDASLHTPTAQELRSWLACQDDVAEVPRLPSPDVVALQLADGVS